MRTLCCSSEWRIEMCSGGVFDRLSYCCPSSLSSSIGYSLTVPIFSMSCSAISSDASRWVCLAFSKSNRLIWNQGILRRGLKRDGGGVEDSFEEAFGVRYDDNFVVISLMCRASSDFHAGAQEHICNNVSTPLWAARTPNLPSQRPALRRRRSTKSTRAMSHPSCPSDSSM